MEASVTPIVPACSFVKGIVAALFRSLSNFLLIGALSNDVARPLNPSSANAATEALVAFLDRRHHLRYELLLEDTRLLWNTSFISSNRFDTGKPLFSILIVGRTDSQSRRSKLWNVLSLLGYYPLPYIVLYLYRGYAPWI